jgi:hypothetical protein
MFGSWTSDVESLARQFASAAPFPHVVIPDFFADPHALAEAFPEASHPGWVTYHNPLEKKHAMPAVAELPRISEAFEALRSAEVLELFKAVSSIQDLEDDPHMHGAGLHAHPRGGKLDVHLDYSVHPITGMERRLNLVVFLNPRWRGEWGGALQLWSTDEAGQLASNDKDIFPAFNTAVLFRTSDASWHGLPAPLACPEGERRMSLAMYYVSPPRAGASQRPKAQFAPLPRQPVDARLANLYDIRPRRCIRPEDLWDGWESDGAAYW